MDIEDTEIIVEDEHAEMKRGQISELTIRVVVINHHKHGPNTTSVFDVVFERDSRGGPLNWRRVSDMGDSDWFSPTHCAVVLHAADYVEENYDADVDTKQVTG